MKVLFIHQNFPGQFVHLAAALARDPDNTVVALSVHTCPVPAGVSLRTYRMLRAPVPATHPLLRDQEGMVLHAEACAAAALKLKEEGFAPELVVAHPGWGEALFIKEVFPAAKLILYCEYYYALDGQDVGFDPELAPLSFAQRCRLRLKNSANLLSMEVADAAISPTAWQKSTYPAWARAKISVIHDGIDLARWAPAPQAAIRLAANPFRPEIGLRAGDEVLTYVARNLEPVRGFQVFMRMLPELQRQRPDAHTVIVGGNEVSYSHRAPGGLSWKQQLLGEVGGALDMARVHFTGRLAYREYAAVMNVSKVHSYWTTPFVLSWSFLEAAASGVALLASDTAPVREYAGRLGVQTLGFFDRQGFADTLAERLARPAAVRVRPPMEELDIGPCTAARVRLLRAWSRA